MSRSIGALTGRLLGEEGKLKKTSLAAIIVAVMALAVTPAGAQGTNFVVVCNQAAPQGVEGKVIVVSENEQSPNLTFLAGPFTTQEAARAVAATFNNICPAQPGPVPPGAVPGQVPPGQVPGQVPGAGQEAAAPPFRAESELEQESESGDVAIGFDVSNTGDYASQCTPASQFGNTGNFDNASSFVQGPGSEADDFEPGGIEVGFGGSNSTECPSTIQQSSAASS